MGAGMTAPQCCPSCGYNLTKDEPIERDGFCIDPRGAVSFQGRPLRLTAGAFTMLLCVARANGRPVHDDTILGYSGSEGTENTVHVQMCRARKAFAIEGAPFPIQRLQGRGYAWSLPA